MRGNETVAGHIVASVPRAMLQSTAAEVRARLAAERPDCVDIVLVTDAEGRLAGALPIARLFALPDDARLASAVDADFPRIAPQADQERAASLALHHRVDALPVVDAAGKPLGVMPAQALLQVLRREHVEDLHRLSGIRRETATARHAIEDPPLRRARHRLPWLLAGLAGAALATATMAGFEATLQAKVAVAFFVPGIVYLADAIGTQSEAIAVRGLSLTRAGLTHLLAGELRTGMTLGAALGLLCLAPIWWAFDDLRLAMAVAVAVFSAGTVASAIGLLLPWVLARLAIDPAYGSGPVATVIQDVISLLVYFGVVLAVGL
ncbi:MAG: magnesium transporter [Pseudomonadota bacterium]